jgi:hypothetical protein
MVKIYSCSAAACLPLRPIKCKQSHPATQRRGLLFEIGNILHCLESPSELCYDFFDTVERQREWPLRNIN